MACVSPPAVFAPPAQRKPLEQEFLVRTQPMLDMSDSQSERDFVRDIDMGPQSSPWRWTGPHPTIKLQLKSTLNRRFHIEFTFPEVTFKDTGPVTVKFLVNDQLLDTVRYDKAGAKVFDQPIPAPMLKEMSENTLAAEIDKPWFSKNDGRKLGFILSRFGLRQ